MEPSAYTAELVPFLSRATAVLNERVKAGALPAVSRFGIWSAVVTHIMDRFVEGYSRVKKCSVPGRGLMSLDVGTVYAHCARVGPIVPACLARDKAHADGFVAAYYYDSDADLLAWLTAHRAAYPLRHARALVAHGIGPTLKKKAAKDLAAAVDALYLLAMPDDVARQLAVEKGVQLGVAGMVAMGAAMSGLGAQ